MGNIGDSSCVFINIFALGLGRFIFFGHVPRFGKYYISDLSISAASTAMRLASDQSESVTRSLCVDGFIDTIEFLLVAVVYVN